MKKLFLILMAGVLLGFASCKKEVVTPSNNSFNIPVAQSHYIYFLPFNWSWTHAENPSLDLSITNHSHYTLSQVPFDTIPTSIYYGAVHGSVIRFNKKWKVQVNDTIEMSSSTNFNPGGTGPCDFDMYYDDVKVASSVSYSSSSTSIDYIIK